MTTGALTSVHFGWERYFNGTAWVGTYGTAAGPYDKVFGEGQKISSLEKGNNTEVIFSLGNRGGVKNIAKKFTGSFGIECNLANPYIFRFILGNGGTVRTETGFTSTVNAAALQGDRLLTVAATGVFSPNDWVKIIDVDPDNIEYIQIESIVSGTVLGFHSPLMHDHPMGDDVTVMDTTGTGDYIHVFTELNEAPSITIQNSFDLDTDQQLLLKGCIPTSCTISAAVDEVISLKIDGEYANEILSTTGFAQQIAESEDMFTFANGSVKKYVGGNWTTISDVIQSFEISINPNNEIIYGLGSRTGKERAGKQFEYDLSLSLMFSDVAEMLELFYTGAAGGAEPGCVDPIMLEFNIADCSTGNPAYKMQFANVLLDTDSLPQDPTAVVMEDVAMKATNMVVWGYNTASVIP